MNNESYTVTVGGKEEHKIVFDQKGMYSGTINGKSFACDVISTSLDTSAESKRFHVIRDNKSYDVEILEHDVAEKTLSVKVNGHTYALKVADKYDDLLRSLGMDKIAGTKVNELKAPMPGLVLDIIVSEGQEVKKGDPVVVLEAMKMENILKSPADVTVKKISVQKGTAVEKNQVLIQFQ